MVGLEPNECAMVAAHLGDMKHPRQVGFRTVYVERAREERCSEPGGEGFVDISIGLGEDGFIAAAEKMCITVQIS